jgi:hypothetical protein
VCVLLDPTWRVENIGLRTKTFESVFEQLCVSKAPQISDDHVFKNIVRILGGSEISEYVNTLLGTALSVQ